MHGSFLFYITRIITFPSNTVLEDHTEVEVVISPVVFIKQFVQPTLQATDNPILVSKSLTIEVPD